MGQLIQIKRSSSNAIIDGAESLPLSAGELAFSGKSGNEELWIGNPLNSGPDIAKFQLTSKTLIDAWNNDGFVMKGAGSSTNLALGTVTTETLSSSGAITSDASVSGLSLVSTSGQITSASDISLSTTTNTYKLGDLIFNGGNSATAGQILQVDSSGKFAPVELDVDALAKAAFSGGNGIDIAANGEITANNTQIQTISRGSVSISNDALPAGQVQSKLEYDSATGVIKLLRGSGIELAQGELNLELSADGQLGLNTTNLVVNKASTIEPTALTGLSPSFTGVAITDGDFVTSGGVNVNFSGNKLFNVGDPVFGHQGANKRYVDSVATGLGILNPVTAATAYTGGGHGSAHVSGAAYGSGILTAATNGAFTLDGYTTFTVYDAGTSTEASRILVKNRTNTWENGIYDLTTLGTGSVPWVLTRSTDADGAPATELNEGSFVFVENGLQGSTGWVVSTRGTGTFGSAGAEIEWAQFSATGAVEGSTTINKNGNELSVAVSSSSALNTAEGLGINVDTAASLEINNNALGINLATSSGLNHAATGLSVLHDNKTLKVDANGKLHVNVDTKHFVDSGDLELNIAVNQGLEAEGTTGLGVKVDPLSAITVGSSGLGVRVSDDADNKITIGTDKGIFVKLREVDDSSIKLTGNSLSVKGLGITNDMLAGGISLLTKVTGELPVANGGFGQGAVSGMIFGNGGGYTGLNGTAGQIMTINASGTPEFATMDGGSF
jgi:hypothetical protein